MRMYPVVAAANRRCPAVIVGVAQKARRKPVIRGWRI
jgi:hypothetical protein